MSYDDFSDLLDTFAKLTEHMLNSGSFEEEFFAIIPRETILQDEGNAEKGELIVGKNYVTYLLSASQRNIKDFGVSVEAGRLKISFDGSEIVEILKVSVDPKSLVTTYRNGVLSVRLRRA
jgi:hypothetical protein